MISGFQPLHGRLRQPISFHWEVWMMPADR
jgi:hypothetical protein